MVPLVCCMLLRNNSTGRYVVRVFNTHFEAVEERTRLIRSGLYLEEELSILGGNDAK